MTKREDEKWALIPMLGNSIQEGRAVIPDPGGYDIVWIAGQSNGYVEIEMVGQHHASGNRWAKVDRDGVVTTSEMT